MQKIKIAKVLKPQGIKGEIKVELFLSDLDFLRSLNSFMIDDNVYNVTSIRFQNKYAYIGTQEVLTRNDAELLRNKFLTIDKDIVPVDKDEYFIEDLENCCVIDENEKLVGYIESVEKYSSIYNINILIGGTLRSFPFLDNVIKKVDIKNKVVVVFREKLNEVLV